MSSVSVSIAKRRSMMPGNRSKFEKMKKVAALQTQKGPWSRDVSGTVKKSHVSSERASTKGFASHKHSLEQQVGPWSQSKRTERSQPPPPPPPQIENKQQTIADLQRMKGPWNQEKLSQMQTDEIDTSKPTSRSRSKSHRHSSSPRHSPPEGDFLKFDQGVFHDAPLSSNPIPKSSWSLESPQLIVCLCNALGLIRKQWGISIAHYFNLWKMQVCGNRSLGQVAHRPFDKSKQKIEYSLLTWITTNSRRKHLRNAWRKWLFGVVAVISEQKSESINELSLALSKENEQYKSKLAAIIQKVKHREGMYRQSVVKSSMHYYFRIRTKLSVKRRFDTWRRWTWQINYDQNMKREKYKVEIGFQAISSEREAMVKAERESSKLQQTLLCLVAFSTWKLKMKEQQYSDNQKQWAREKKIIQDNLSSLQKSLIKLNKSETEMVETAKNRGMEMYSALYLISEKLGKCSSTPPSKIPVSGGGILKKKKKILFEDET